MNQLKLIGIFVVCTFFGRTLSYAQETPIDRAELDAFILNKMIETQKVFQWNEVNNSQLHAALILSDSMAVIGYQPENFSSIRTKMHQLDLKNEAWLNARNKLIDHIVSRTNQLQNKKVNKRDLMPFAVQDRLPYFL